jgi:hypothetical protein
MATRRAIPVDGSGLSLDEAVERLADKAAGAIRDMLMGEEPKQPLTEQEVEAVELMLLRYVSNRRRRSRRRAVTTSEG